MVSLSIVEHCCRHFVIASVHVDFVSASEIKIHKVFSSFKKKEIIATFCFLLRRVWRYQMVTRICKSKNRQHNDQTKKGQMDKQRSTNTTHKTKDWVTRTPLKTGGELRCYGRVISSFSTSGTGRITQVKIPVISHDLSLVPCDI